MAVKSDTWKKEAHYRKSIATKLNAKWCEICKDIGHTTNEHLAKDDLDRDVL